MAKKKTPQPPARVGGKKAGRKTPQPPVPAPPLPQYAPGAGAGAYNVGFTPSVQSQLTQPYLDVMAGTAYGNMPNVARNLGGQQDWAGLYGGMGGQQFGRFMQGAPQEQGLTTQMGGQAGGTLGAYGQVMNPNLPLIANLQGQLADIQAGKDTGFDPYMTQQYNQSEQQLHDTLRKQLGPDYATSSAGINALNQFNQEKQTAFGSARFQRQLQIQDALQQAQQNLAGQAGGFANIYGGQRGQQFGQADVLGQRFGQFANDIYNTTMGLGTGALAGQGQYYGNQGALMNLTGAVPAMMGQYGGAMTGQAGAAVSAQAPYQQDRLAQFQASTYPTSGQFMGEKMAQSGNRWASIGANIGSMGGSAAAAGGGGG